MNNFDKKLKRYEKIMTIISIIFLLCVGIVLMVFHEKLDMDFFESSLFMLIFIELINYKIDKLC